MSVMKLRTPLLPLLTLTWLSPRSLLAGGHDCVPILFSLESSGKLVMGPKLEEDKKVRENNSKRIYIDKYIERIIRREYT